MSGFVRLMMAVLVLALSFLAGYYFLVMPVQREIELYVGKGDAYDKGCFTPDELDMLLSMGSKKRESYLQEKGLLCTLKFKKIELEQAEEDLKRWEEAVSEFEKVLKELQKEISATKEDFISSLLKDMTNLINDLRRMDPDLVLSNIQFGSLSTETLGSEEGEGGFTTQSVNVRMSLTGHYQTLIKLMDDLGQLKLKKMVKINRLNLSPRGQLEPGRSPVLSISLTLKAFMFKGGG